MRYTITSEHARRTLQRLLELARSGVSPEKLVDKTGFSAMHLLEIKGYLDEAAQLASSRDEGLKRTCTHCGKLLGHVPTLDELDPKTLEVVEDLPPDIFLKLYGNPFCRKVRPVRSDALYCSSNCRQAAHRKKRATAKVSAVSTDVSPRDISLDTHAELGVTGKIGTEAEALAGPMGR